MVDERVRAAIKNWAPRFIAQGVDYNDFFRTTVRVEKWEDWCREWCSTGDVHAGLADETQSAGNSVSAGEAYITAGLCYHFGKFLFQARPEEYRAACRKSIEAYTKGVRLLDSTAERVEIPFQSGALVGWFRRPSGDLGTRWPLVLLVPGLDSVKEEFFHWENVFLKRGLATFSLDGPGQGECGLRVPMRPDYEVAVAAALDVLAARGDVNLDRVGLAGVSLGGYYAPRAAAFEPRVKAAVGVAGPWDFGECWSHLPSLTRAAFQYHCGAKDQAEALAMAGQFHLDGAAQRIRQPLLIIHGEQDRIIPVEQARKIVNAASSNAELVVLAEGNHVCNNLPYVYRPLAADWLKEKLG